MGSAAGVGGRNFLRGLIAVTTVGASEAGLAVMPKCGVCGHQKSLHRETFTEKAQRQLREAKEREAERLQRPAASVPQDDRPGTIREMMAAEERKSWDALPDQANSMGDGGTATPSHAGPPAGFYNDPERPHDQLRWWDGSAWSDFTKPRDQ